MKKIVFFLICSMPTFFANAQNEFDALCFAKNDILGTARYMGMAGAFSSLGGDPTVMTTNPAGLGLYRSSELTFTANLAANATKTDYFNDSKIERWTRLNVNNFSYVMAIPYYTGTHKVSSGTVGISFNRQANFNRRFKTAKVMPIDQTVATLINDISQGIFLEAFQGVAPHGNPWFNQDIAWLSTVGFQTGLIHSFSDDPKNADYTTGFIDSNFAAGEMEYSESGFINEWAFTYSHNFDDKFYLGATLGAKNMEYERNSYYTEWYFEDGAEHSFEDFYLANWQRTTGAGFNLKIGGIVRLMDNLRVALAFNSPTWYSMTSRYDVYGEAYFSNNGHGTSLPPDSLLNIKKYSYTSPYKILAGASYIIAQRAIISLDYELTDYNSMRLREWNGGDGWFAEANNTMSDNFKTSHTFKLGGEYRLTNNFSLRAGLANVSRTTAKDAVLKLVTHPTEGYVIDVNTSPEHFIDRGTQYCSLGFGYRNAGFFFDMAYLLRSNKSDFYSSEYDWVAQKIRSNTHNIAATVGFRF